MNTTRLSQFVYFLGTGNLVKIGYTDQPIEQRMNQLKTGSPLVCQVDIILLGDRKTEKAFHRKFEKYHSKGEWFLNRKLIIDEVAKDLIQDHAELIVYISEELKGDWNNSTVAIETISDQIMKRTPIPYPNEPDKLLKAKEVASILNISRTQAYRLMKNEIPSIRFGGATVRVRSGDLKKYVDLHEI